MLTWPNKRLGSAIFSIKQDEWHPCDIHRTRVLDDGLRMEEGGVTGFLGSIVG